MSQMTEARSVAARERVTASLRGTGIFSSVVSSELSFSSFESHQSTFFLALVLSALQVSDDAVLARTREELAHRLRKEMSAIGSWNYWLQGSADAQNSPFPDDLDTTSAALRAFAREDSAFFSGAVMARFVELLMAVEVEPGGPYRTWLVGEGAAEAWKDIDPVVNANIGALLSELEIELPGLSAFLTAAVANRSVLSPYYPSRIPFLYFVSRIPWSDDVKKMLCAEIHEQRAHALNALETAMMVTSLVHLGENGEVIHEYYDSLLASIERGEADRPYAFCIDRIEQGVPYFAGARELTLACALEAVEKYLAYAKPAKRENADMRLERLFTEVRARALGRFTHCSFELKAEGERTINALLQRDTGHFKSLFPYMFAFAYGVSENIDDAWFVHVSLAHFFGWLAYTIYDNVLDDELVVSELPVANICLRESTALFAEVLPREFVDSVFDNAEGANTWEAMQCRFEKVESSAALPDFGGYEKLVQRSFGLVLSPLAVLVKSGFALHSSEASALKEFMRHYIIVKQLNDDAHDFEDDLLRGQLNPVNIEVLRVYFIHHSGSFDRAQLAQSVDELRKIFWYDVVEKICADIFLHVEKGELAILSMPLGTQHFLQKFIQPFKASAAKSLEERNKMIAFLAAFKI